MTSQSLIKQISVYNTSQLQMGKGYLISNITVNKGWKLYQLTNISNGMISGSVATTFPNKYIIQIALFKLFSTPISCLPQIRFPSSCHMLMYSFNIIEYYRKIERVDI